MDNQTIDGQLFNRKTSAYGDEAKLNFAMSNELTVTITLEEYRQLVSRDAKRAEAIDAARTKQWKAEADLATANTEIAKLKEKITYMLMEDKNAEPTE